MTQTAPAPIPPPSFENLPFPVACSCALFNEFLLRGELVAAWLQARDVYEVVTKIGVAFLTAEEVACGAGMSGAARLVTRMLTKQLSFGDWVDILREAAAVARHLEADTPRIVGPRLYEVVFRRTSRRKDPEAPAMGILRQAVRWRNDEIGHGALGRKSEYLHDTVEYQSTRITELLGCIAPLAELRLVARSGGGEEVDLTGPRLPAELGAERRLYLCRSADRRAVSLHPLMLLELDPSCLAPGVLIFDKRVVSSSGQPKADVYLDYEAGKKVVIPTVPMERLGEAVGAVVRDRIEGNDSRLAETLRTDRASYSASLHEQIQKLRLGLDDERRFVTPQATVAKIRAWLEARPRGYLHVIGRAGVGKSWLAGNLQRVDVLGDEYAGSVLTFHAGFGSAQSQAVFVSELNAQALRRFDRMQALLAEERTPWAAQERLARLLAELADSSATGEVILVVDGVDEVVDVPDRDVSILDFLPDAGSLTEGVHVVLLSRPAVEMSETARHTLGRLKTSAASDPHAWHEIHVDPASGEQHELIREIIERRLAHCPSELRQLVLDESGGIPLRATHLCTLVDMSGGRALDHVGGNLSTLYAAYFTRMRERIGATWFGRLYRPLISVLAVVREALDLEALSEILDVPTERVYLASLDLADCLRTRRHAGESSTFLEVNHAELRQFVRDDGEMWQEGHARLARRFMQWWRYGWLARSEVRAERYAVGHLPLHLVGARDGEGLERLLVYSLGGTAPSGLPYLEVVLDGLRSQERMVAMDMVRDRLAFLADVLDRSHQRLRANGSLSEEASSALYRVRIQTVASLADRHAHTSPQRALEVLAGAIELARGAAADCGEESRRELDTEQAILLYKLHENLQAAGRSEDARAALNRSLRLRETLAASAVDREDRMSQLGAVVWCHLGLASSGGVSETEKAEHLGRSELVLREIEQLGVKGSRAVDAIGRLQAVVASSLASIRRDEMAVLLEQAVAAFRRVRETSPDDRHLEYSLASTERYLAYARLEHDEVESALVHLGEAEQIVTQLLGYEPGNAFYIRLDAHLRRLRSRLKLRGGDFLAARTRMRDACQRIELAGLSLKNALVQREIDEFRKELAAVDSESERRR